MCHIDSWSIKAEKLVYGTIYPIKVGHAFLSSSLDLIRKSCLSFLSITFLIAMISSSWVASLKSNPWASV